MAVEKLKTLGLTEVDVRAYIFLAKKGPKNEKDLAHALSLTKRQLRSTLKRLMNKEMVQATSESSIKYSAITFKNVFDNIVKIRKEQAKLLQASRMELLSIWNSLIEKNKEVDRDH